MPDRNIRLQNAWFTVRENADGQRVLLTEDVDGAVGLRKANAVAYGAVASGNTSQVLVPANPDRISLLIVNHGSTLAYLLPGGDAVTASNGIALAPAEDGVPRGSIVDYDTTVEWRVIVPSGTPDVRWVETSYEAE